MTPNAPVRPADHQNGALSVECHSIGTDFREPHDEQRSMKMLSIAMLLAVQGLIWFAIGYFVCRWVH